MAGDYELVEAELDSAWDAFVESSPHGTIYSSSAFLRALNDRSMTYYCLQRGKVAGAVVMTADAAGHAAKRSEAVVYNGVLCAPMDGQPPDAEVARAYFRTTEFIVDELARRHDYVDMQLPPAFVDARPFLWHNHGSAHARFTVDVRYTSHIDIRDILENEEVALGRAMRVRRSEVRRARSLGIDVKEGFEPALCAELFRRSMQRQGIRTSSATLSEMRAIMTSLAADGIGRMFFATGPDGVPVSAVFMGVDRKRGYYLFGGSDPSARKGPAGTAVLWETFRALRTSGVVHVDVEGVNSPKRGWFKLSFGGTLMPYYGLTLDQRVSDHE